MDLASHLGMSLQEVQAKTSSTELPLWAKYLRVKKDEEYANHSKMEYYYALILAEIRRTIVKHPNKVNWKNFLLKFDLKEPSKDAADRMKKSKSAWQSILGGFKKKKDIHGSR